MTTKAVRIEKAFYVLAAGLVVYELVALRNKCEGDTISELVWAATTKRPLVPFAAGLLCGHFFWQRVESASTAPAREAL